MTNQSEVVFTAAYDREVRVSADRQKVTHRAMGWSAEYTPEQLLTWLAFYQRKADQARSPYCVADVEVLCAARDLLAKERARP